LIEIIGIEKMNSIVNEFSDYSYPVASLDMAWYKNWLGGV